MKPYINRFAVGRRMLIRRLGILFLCLSTLISLSACEGDFFVGEGWPDPYEDYAVCVETHYPQESIVTINRVSPFEGPVYYVGEIPRGTDCLSEAQASGGTLVTVVERIDVPPSQEALLFVRAGHSTDECGDPNAVSLVEGGESLGLGGAYLFEVYTFGTHILPTPIVACVPLSVTASMIQLTVQIGVFSGE
jgi:hypothetical protein